LSWHPSKENLLAYGTDDGRVGVCDVLSSRFVFISNQTSVNFLVAVEQFFCYMLLTSAGAESISSLETLPLPTAPSVSFVV